MKQTLNPNFFNTYQLDAYFPADWKLSLSIKNNSGLFTDTEIGSKEFDLEDRFFGNITRLNRLSYNLRIEHYSNLKRRLSDKRSPLNQNIDTKKELAKVASMIKNLNEHLKPLITDREDEPIEYCSLSQTGKRTMQGSVEIVLQVLDLEEASDVPIPKFEAPQPQTFEVRLIIWEVFDIPLNGKDGISIFVRVSTENDGWSSDRLAKDTDAHLNSKGYGLFNYRLLFPLTLPCAFPRIKISVFDFNAFSDDQALGSVRYLCLSSYERLQ